MIRRAISPRLAMRIFLNGSGGNVGGDSDSDSDDAFDFVLEYCLLEMEQLSILRLTTAGDVAANDISVL